MFGIKLPILLSKITSKYFDEFRILPKLDIILFLFFLFSERSFGRERLCKHKYSNYCVDDVLSQDKEAPSR